MKYTVILMIAMTVLTGCSALTTGPAPKSMDKEEWFDYGELQSNAGYEVLTKQELSEHSNFELGDELFNAYQQGYKKGQIKYCEQNPYFLGRSKKVYRGICNDIDPDFVYKYLEGKKVDKSGHKNM